MQLYWLHLSRRNVTAVSFPPDFGSYLLTSVSVHLRNPNSSIKDHRPAEENSCQISAFELFLTHGVVLPSRVFSKLRGYPTSNFLQQYGDLKGRNRQAQRGAAGSTRCARCDLGCQMAGPTMKRVGPKGAFESERLMATQSIPTLQQPTIPGAVPGPLPRPMSRRALSRPSVHPTGSRSSKKDQDWQDLVIAMLPLVKRVALKIRQRLPYPCGNG